MSTEHLKVMLCNKFFTPVGGAETVIFEQIKMLEENGHSVIPFAMRHPDNLPSEYSKYFVSEVDYKKPKNAAPGALLRNARDIIYSKEAARKISDLIDATHPDIAHLHNIYHQLSPSICPALKRKGIPMVMTLHDSKLLCPNYLSLRDGKICELCSGGRYCNAVRYSCVKGSRAKSMICAAEMYLHSWLRLYEGNIDLFIAPSEFLRNRFIQDRGLPADRIVHVPNAIDLSGHTPVYSNDGYCVFVGRITEYKGIMTLMEAMRAARSVRLRIVGDGDARQKAEQFKKEYSLDNVTFEGFQTGEALRGLVQGASFMVIPSECYENCPMTILESFASGKPVIGSRLGGIPEMIDDGVNGLLFDAGNAEDLAQKITSLSSQPELVVEMGRSARATVETRYSPEDHSKSILDIYRRVIASHQG